MVGVIALFIFLFLIVVIVLLITGGIKESKARKKKMRDLGANHVFQALHVEGLGIYPNALCDIFHFDDRILIDSKPHKFEIRLEQLRAAVVKTEQELVEKGKSVVGRALIGTLLVPGLGTIVGGMSGIGTKKKTGKTNRYLIFNFIDSKGELAAVTFRNNFNVIKIHEFCEAVNKSVAPRPNDDGVIQL
jgi:hypothetical protein